MSGKREKNEIVGSTTSTKVNFPFWFYLLSLFYACLGGGRDLKAKVLRNARNSFQQYYSNMTLSSPITLKPCPFASSYLNNITFKLTCFFISLRNYLWCLLLYQMNIFVSNILTLYFMPCMSERGSYKVMVFAFQYIYKKLRNKQTKKKTGKVSQLLWQKCCSCHLILLCWWKLLLRIFLRKGKPLWIFCRLFQNMNHERGLENVMLGNISVEHSRKIVTTFV